MGRRASESSRVCCIRLNEPRQLEGVTVRRNGLEQEFEPISVDVALARAKQRLERKISQPQAVEHTLEECQEIVNRLTAIRDRRILPPSVRMADFFANPKEVLLDASRWPNADDLMLSRDQVVAAYRSWLLRRARESSPDWHPAMDHRNEHGGTDAHDRYGRAVGWLENYWSLALPVGGSCPEFAEGLPGSPFREVLPFEDAVYAGLVLDVRHQDRWITIFFLVAPDQYQVLDKGEWVPTGQEGEGIPVWRINGRGVLFDPQRPRKFSEIRSCARIFWKSIGGYALVPGRPKGSRDRSVREIIDALIAYKAEHGPNPPSRQSFLDYFLWDRQPSYRLTVWRRLTRDWGITWSELRRAVYGDIPVKSRRIH